MASERRTTSRNGTLEFRIIDAPFHTGISRCSRCHIRPRHRHWRCPTRLVRESDTVTSVYLSCHVVNKWSLPAPEAGIRKRCCMACWTAGRAGRVGRRALCPPGRSGHSPTLPRATRSTAMVSAGERWDIGGMQELSPSLLREEINVPTGGETGDRVWAKHRRSQIFGTRLSMGKSRSPATIRAGPSQ
jgi:hypothetical protein